MNEIQIYQNQEFGAIRTMKNEQGEAMFCGKDVAEALGYNNPLKAIRNHVDSEDKGVNELGTPGGKQKIIFINESGLYALILSSKTRTYLVWTERGRDFIHKLLNPKYVS